MNNHNQVLATSVEPITKGPGILFNPIGTLRVVDDHFHVVIPIDISYINHHLENIRETFSTVRFLCQQNEPIRGQCHNMMQPLDSLFSDILRDHNSISHLTSSSPIRRSAWFSGVGTVFKHIFGTLSEEDAEKYNNAIRILYDNDSKLTNSLTDSIIVSQSAISNLNRSLYELNRNEAILDATLENLTHSLNNVSKIMNELAFENQITHTLNSLQANMITLSFKVEDIVNSVLFTKTNTLHPSIITPKQLYNDILKHVNLMPKYKDFPVDLHLNNIHLLMNLSELISYFLDNNLFFIVKIPLVTLTEFNLFKNIPVPTPLNVNKSNTFSMILSEKPFIALSKDKTVYVTLENLQKCKTIFEDKFMCDETEIFSVIGYPSCETEIMTKAITHMPNQCNHKFLFGYIDIWHRLSNDKWIFIQSESTKLSIDCNNNLTELTISGAGVLNIEPECIAYCRSNKLLSKSNPKVSIINIRPEYSITDDKCCNIQKFKDLNLDTSHQSISNINLDNLKYLKLLSDQNIENLKSVKPSEQFVNHVSFPIFSVLSIIFCVSVIILYFCKKYEYLQSLICKDQSDPENPEIQIADESDPGPRLRID